MIKKFCVENPTHVAKTYDYMLELKINENFEVLDNYDKAKIYEDIRRFLGLNSEDFE